MSDSMTTGQNRVAESALAGPAIRRGRSALRRAHATQAGGASSSEPPASGPQVVDIEQVADIERVLQRIRTILITQATAPTPDAAISSVLRDPQFAAAWNNANAALLARTPREKFLSPVVEDSLRPALGGYRDEIQMVATAWATVMRGVFSNDVRSDAKHLLVDRPARLLLPAYLDDD